MGLGARVVCPQCTAEYRIVSRIAPGETASCPKCGAKAVVPRPQDAEAPLLDRASLAGSPDDRRVTLSLPPAGGATLSIEGAGAEVSVGDALLSTGPAATRYAEEGVIAQGGMGEIVLCVDRDTRRQVAMKRMLPETAADPARRARFVEEAQVTAQLEHPNIVPVHELRRRDDGSVYFTMKLVKGKSLEAILAEAKQGKGSPPLGELFQVFIKVCDGVAFAHSKGVLHRDLKPANIMVGDYGEVLVMDWGLAKVRGREDTRASALIETSRVHKADSRTIEGSALGTPAYMPPEQAEGKLDLIDERSDVYSLGAILYEILTLEKPVQGETMFMVLANTLKGHIAPPEQRAPKRNVPRELSAIAMKCLSKVRARRYHSVMQLRKDVGLFLEGRSVSAKPDTLGQAVVKLVKRNKGVSAAVGAAALVLIAVTAFFLINLTRQRNEAVSARNIADTQRREAQAARDAQRATALAASKRQAESAARAASEGRLDEAKARADAAQEVMPDGPWGHYALGVLAHEKKDLGVALFGNRLTDSATWPCSKKDLKTRPPLGHTLR